MTEQRPLLIYHFRPLDLNQPHLKALGHRQASSLMKTHVMIIQEPCLPDLLYHSISPSLLFHW